MAVEFTIPKLGDNVTEATIVDWLVADGAEVAEGDELLEVETDKAVIPVPAPASGVIKFGNFKAGDIVKIDQVVATIEAQNGDPAPDTPSAPAEPAAAAPAEPSNGHQPAPAAAEGIKITPVARKMAQAQGVDLSSLSGSGEHGKITKLDVLQAVSGEVAPDPAPAPAPATPAPLSPQPAPAPAPKPAPAAAPIAATPEGDVLERHPLKGIRGVIARRMAESTQTTARVTLVTEVDATELVSLREQLKARYAESWGFAPGYNDLLAMIVASGLRQFPYMNARFSADGEAIEHLKPVNMGMAVDTDRGLLVTVIRDADRKGLQEIGSEFRDLVKKARGGKASPDELSGSTFTITSLGTFRVDAFTPVINLPEAAILGVGRIADKAVVKDGQIVARKMMTLSLVFDHRLTDGAPAARFLDYVCELIEEPYLLFLTRK
ncbi:MAG: pyruvate dehydrogenase complex dihydrolipoyllysine-residue acetyltransferase [Anaerolineae bacterium]